MIKVERNKKRKVCVLWECIYKPRGVIPGPRPEERAGASSGPATVRISGGNTVPAETNKNPLYYSNLGFSILICLILTAILNTTVMAFAHFRPLTTNQNYLHFNVIFQSKSYIFRLISFHRRPLIFCYFQLMKTWNLMDNIIHLSEYIIIILSKLQFQGVAMHLRTGKDKKTFLLLK